MAAVHYDVSVIYHYEPKKQHQRDHNPFARKRFARCAHAALCPVPDFVKQTTHIIPFWLRWRDNRQRYRDAGSIVPDHH